MYKYYCGAEKNVNISSNFIGNINPLRYQGWYWDTDINHYYVGDGMFYDAINEIYVQNDYVMQDWGWEILHNAAAVFSLTRVEINAIAGEYETIMSQPSYGATNYSNVTEAQWQKGDRWYDGVSDVEAVARCIFAENTYDNRLNDRIGVAAVIINRKAARNLSAKGVVTQYQQFSTMNPKYYEDSNSANCKTARMVHSKTDTTWQQATLLACIACSANTSVGTDISYFYNMPSCISNQQYFRGFKSTNSSFKYDGTTVKFGASEVCDVAIVDYGYITSEADLKNVKENYVLSGYNIFFNYR